MIIDSSGKFTRLTADDGYVLANGETVSKSVCLGKNDSVDNWTQIIEEETTNEAD